MIWNRGKEAPPFVSTNKAVVRLLVGLVNGELDPPAAIFISKTVAVQIWQLIFDSSACAELLKDAGKQRFFVILASLALGIRVRDADPNAVDSLPLR